MSMSDVRGAQVGAGFGHGRSLSQERSLQSQDRNRAKSRTRVHGLADIDPKFISQVRWEIGDWRGRISSVFLQVFVVDTDWPALFLPNDISYFAP